MNTTELDAIPGVSRLIRHFVVPLLAGRRGEDRRRVAECLPRLAHTAQDVKVEERRLWLLVNWLIQEELPAVYEAAADDCAPDLVPLKTMLRHVAADYRLFPGIQDRADYAVMVATMQAQQESLPLTVAQMMTAVVSAVDRYADVLAGHAEATPPAFHVGVNPADIRAAGGVAEVVQRGAVQLPIELYLNMLDRLVAAR